MRWRHWCGRLRAGPTSVPGPRAEEAQPARGPRALNHPSRGPRALKHHIRHAPSARGSSESVVRFRVGARTDCVCRQRKRAEQQRSEGARSVKRSHSQQHRKRSESAIIKGAA
jgi:hypothetical protein